MRSMCVGVAETGVNSFLFLSFSFFSDKRKEHCKESIFMLIFAGGRCSTPVLATPFRGGYANPELSSLSLKSAIKEKYL